jgi:excisionase family DNA binding protein
LGFGAIMAIETVEKVNVEVTRNACGTCGEAPNDRHEAPSDHLSVEKRPTYPVQPESPTPEKRRQGLVPIGPAAEYLGVSRATVERLVYRGELPMVKVGGSTRYDVDDLDDYVEIN